MAAISPRPPRQTFYGWYDEEKAAYDASFEAARTATDLGTAQSAYNQAHEDAETARTERESAKQAADGALAVLSTARTESDAADDAYVAARSIDDARIEQREVDQTYTADMTDPDNGISGLAARKMWRSIPSQLLRSSTKKFKYSEVECGGRRAKLIEPLDWLEAAGIISINALTDCAEAPLVPYDDTEGSFFKVYLSDTGLMFYKLGVNPRLWLESQEQGLPLGSSDFRGALAENSVMQALRSNDLQTYYWTPPSSWSATGELDFLLQTQRMEVIPVEVKSARNVRARTLGIFMERSGSPFAYVLSENDYSRESTATGGEVRHLPLYAAHCTGGDCLKVEA